MNTEAIKIRHIRDLKKKKKKTIKECVYNKYNWTVDEEEYMKPFILKPPEVSNTSRCNTVFTKGEAFELLDKYVENTTTLNNYKSKVNVMMKLMNVENEEYSLIFKDIDLLVLRIIEKYKDPTCYFSSMLYILSKSQKLLDVIPKKSFDVIKSKFEEYKNKQIVKHLNDRQNNMEYEKVFKRIVETEKKYSEEQYASMKHIITVMYTKALYDSNGHIHINPRNYFDKVLLIESDEQLNEDENFYNIKTGRLVINDYKTSGIYKPYDVVLTSNVQKIINDSLKTKRTYLIEKESGGLIVKNTLSEMFKRIFGYNINTVRKSIESYEINVNKGDRLHLANVSRHSILTQEVSYLSRI